jgi:small subunit ribosomal protein S6
VRGVIESMGGVVLNVDNWGKRKLAYEIKKELKGIYLFWNYLASPGVVAEFERNMRMLDSVIRYMTIVAARDVDPASKTTEVNEETYAKAATTAADEEELMMRRPAGEDGEEGEGGMGDDDDDGEFRARRGAAAAAADDDGDVVPGAAKPEADAEDKE